jgi:hypothetical protein
MAKKLKSLELVHAVFFSLYGQVPVIHKVENIYCLISASEY